jgi:hypothetical protein
MGFGVIGAGRCNFNFSNMASSVRAGRFSIWLLVVIFIISFSNGLQFRADVFQTPQQRQAQIVGRNYTFAVVIVLVRGWRCFCVALFEVSGTLNVWIASIVALRGWTARKTSSQHGVCRKQGWTVGTSPANQCAASVRAGRNAD